MGYLHKETKRIWLTLNNPAIHASIKLTLESKGYETGQTSLNRRIALLPESEALKEIEEFKPDLVLLNVDQADSPGFELCRLIRANPSLARIRVILFGAEPGMTNILKAYQMGASYYVGVPADDYSMLLGLVDKVLLSSSYPSGY